MTTTNTALVTRTGMRLPPARTGSAGVASPSPARCSRYQADRKSTRLNSSHSQISYAVFCLKKKKRREDRHSLPHGHVFAHGIATNHPRPFDPSHLDHRPHMPMHHGLLAHRVMHHLASHSIV